MEDYIFNLPKTLNDLKSNPDKEITVVMGNESCDLDSAVCALTLAHHLNKKGPAIPLLNIPKEDVPLRTEVIHCVGKTLVHQIPSRDDIDLSAFERIRLIMVDHHVLLAKDLKLASQIIMILDHRQRNENAKFPQECQTRIELVGSCSTLVAQLLLSEGYNDALGLELLRNTIITDTENFSPVVKKATPLDQSVVEQIEEMLPDTLLSRSATFENIKAAKGSIEGFSAEQLMRKDLKIVSFQNGTVAAVPSTLLLASEICAIKNLEEIETIFEDFCRKYKAKVLIIVGLNTRIYGRDLLLFYTHDYKAGAQLTSNIAQALIDRGDCGAQLTDVALPPRCVHLLRNDPTSSRKKLVPVILSVEDKIY